MSIVVIKTFLAKLNYFFFTLHRTREVGITYIVLPPSWYIVYLEKYSKIWGQGANLPPYLLLQITTYCFLKNFEIPLCLLSGPN